MVMVMVIIMVEKRREEKEETQLYSCNTLAKCSTSCTRFVIRARARQSRSIIVERCFSPSSSSLSSSPSTCSSFPSLFLFAAVRWGFLSDFDDDEEEVMETAEG